MENRTLGIFAAMIMAALLSTTAAATTVAYADKGLEGTIIDTNKCKDRDIVTVDGNEFVSGIAEAEGGNFVATGEGGEGENENAQEVAAGSDGNPEVVPGNDDVVAMCGNAILNGVEDTDFPHLEEQINIKTDFSDQSSNGGPIVSED